MKDEIVRFKSLCEATSKFLEPLKLHKSDRLHVSLNDDGKHFITRAYGEVHTHQTILVEPTEFRLRDATPEWTVETKTGFGSFAANVTWPERVPEKKLLTGYAQTMMPTTDTNALLLYSLWPSNQLVFDDDSYVAYEFLLTRFAHQSHSAVSRARGLEGNGELLDRADNPRAPYQNIALNGTMNQEGGGLFMDPGTGKSAIAVARVCNEAVNQDEVHRILVVCPKNVRSNWRNEFLKFATTNGKLLILQGGKLDRVKQLIEAFVDCSDETQWVVVICSYEAVATTWDAMRMCEWDLAVADESHFMKSTYTKRFAQMMELRNRCRQRMCLSGTPITNSPMDLYAQFEFMGEDLSGFRNFSAFRAFYGTYIKTADGMLSLVGLQNIPLLKERLARLCFIIKKSDALPYLPEKTYDIIDVEMTVEQARVYKGLARDLIAEIESDLLEGGPRHIVVRSALTKLLRLAQVTSGYTVGQAMGSDGFLGEKEILHFDPNPKLEAIVELLKKKASTEKTIIWTCWVPNIKTLRARLDIENVGQVTYYGRTSDKDRAIAEDRFANDPECKVLIGNPAAGGTGLNLLGYGRDEDDHDCTHVIYFAQDWSMVHRTQSEDRSHRRGTRRRVRYTDVMVIGSIDEKIRSRVIDKRMAALELQDLREILSGLATEVTV